jgi:hypothetical protein
MSFDAHGSVQGAPATQPVMEGGAIPDTQSAPKNTPAPAAKTETPKPAAPAAGAQDPAITPETPAYAPNFKFKVMDKEHEIAETFRSIIKDAETEKLVKELHEKAYGLDVVKPRFNDLREKYKSVEQEAKGYKEGIASLREHYQRGDFDSFFQKLNIPQEKVLQWVLDKAHYNELPPEQRQVLDAKRSAEQRAAELEKSQAAMQGKYEDALVQAKARDLQIALERDDVRQFAEAFDARAGKPGSFLEEVIQRGELAWYTSKGKTELTPEQAIQEVLTRYQGLVQSKPKEPPMIPVNGNTPAGQAPAQAPAASTTPTLPNIGGRQSSSVSKSKPRSIDDLKQLYKKMSQGA